MGVDKTFISFLPLNKQRENADSFEIPDDVRREFTESELEPECYSRSYDFFNSLDGSKLNILQELYFQASIFGLRNIAWNAMIILSQIEYHKLGEWACLLAAAATKSIYMDVAEMAVRCFENWNDKHAVTFLKKCKLAEPWLREYAADVCEEIECSGSCITVDKSWKNDFLNGHQKIISSPNPINQIFIDNYIKPYIKCTNMEQEIPFNKKIQYLSVNSDESISIWGENVENQNYAVARMRKKSLVMIDMPMTMFYFKASKKMYEENPIGQTDDLRGDGWGVLFEKNYSRKMAEGNGTADCYEQGYAS